MALVMLPCDLPWWDTLQTHIKKLAAAQKVEELIAGMQIIHTMCNIGLDPDEQDGADPQVLNGFKSFMNDDLTDGEREHFFNVTLSVIAEYALNLRNLKPTTGLRFSLQQEASCIELTHDLAASLISHAFLSTFPKRTNKTHPTLQDFNFSRFFRHLNQKFQKSKLRSILHYFDVQRQNLESLNQITITRQVMKGSEWLTIEDWFECTQPLCPLTFKHDNRMENADLDNSVTVCFSSKKSGGRVLDDGTSTECIQFVTCPELLVILLCVEALEDNETLMVENVLKVGKISNLRLKELFEPINAVNTMNLCCMDAENYGRLPLSQYEEDNILRELNKALLGFRQKKQLCSLKNSPHQPVTRRLSPIGESFSTTPTEKILPRDKQNVIKRKDNLKLYDRPNRAKFIRLGSSGELLPVSRNYSSSDEYSSCGGSQDSSPEYYSAKTSLPDYDYPSDEEENVRRYSGQLDTMENRNSFAERLRAALCRAQSSSSTDSSYAVDISVAGSSIADSNIRMKRGGSRGFMLEDDSLDNRESQLTVSKKHNLSRQHSPSKTQNKRNSSKYSFSTDYNSDLSEVCEQLNKWLEDDSEESNSPNHTDRQQQKIRNNIIIQFAGGLLKRTLSESFVGLCLTEGDDLVSDLNDKTSKNAKSTAKIKTAVRSLSLELAKHKHRLAAQLISAIGNEQHTDNELRVVITGNWGCGSRNLGDPQLKFLIQWLAASIARVPQIVYYTYNHRKLLKLDTVCRVLLDRNWNVGQLVQAVIHYIQFTFNNQNAVATDEVNTLFDLLINSNEILDYNQKSL